MDDVTVDTAEGVMDIPHIGITLRTLLAVAANTKVRRRVWKVRYKGTVIGSVRIKDKWEEPPIDKVDHHPV